MDTTLKASIDEVHRHVTDCAQNIVRVLIENGHLDTGRARELILYASQLFKLTPEVSRPAWLPSILEFDGKELRSTYSKNHAYEFTAFILSNIRNIEAAILTPDEVNYDFDLAFDDVREAENIPATFDDLIGKLEEIIAADLIDSRVVQQALERLMALLKRNKHGSLTSILVSLHYGRFALKAFGGVLSANKYLKPMVEAFKKEFAVAEAKVQDAEAKLKEEAIHRLTNEQRLMSYLSQNGVDASNIAGYLTVSDAEGDTA
ncbi:hypothetical protein [Rosistilla oblonga]|uniref:hypothetical protein n=1 Tax=Rosistilla oblonga TaxID=2527990 RepID=UPI003A97C1A2